MILFGLLIVSSTTIAQSLKIKGDTIFVNESVEVEVKFPSSDIEGRFVDRNPPYAFDLASASVFLHAKTPNVPCSRLVINEGKRDHSFVVCYRKNINQNILKEVVYDYSTYKLLQKRVKEIEDRDASKELASSNQATISGSNVKEPPAPKSSSSASSGVSSSNSNSYYSLLEDGDRALKEGDLDKAANKYQEVLRMQPGNNFAQKGLENVEEKKVQKEKLVRQERENKLNDIKIKANRALLTKNYDEALQGYNDVLALNPDDTYAKNQVKIVEKNLADAAEKQRIEQEKIAKKAAEDKINNLKQNGAQALSDKRYDEAIKVYQDVLALSPNDEISKSRIQTIQKIKEQDILKAKEAAANKNRDESFKAMMSTADKAFEDKEYELAKAGYMSAKEIKSTDPTVVAKIKLAEERIANKDNEDAYNTAIILGDEAKKVQDYEKAKEQFNKALKLFKDKKYPQEQIAEINTIISSNNAKINAEKEKEAKEALISTKYHAAIERGDKAFIKEDFVAAKLAFTEALTYKTGEEYPKEKLAEITRTIAERELATKMKSDSLAKASTLNKEYIAALQKGKGLMAKNDLDGARKAFEQASELKPDDPEPKSQLDIIESKTNSKENNAKYEAAMAKGNIAAAEKNYKEALESYKAALRIKPLENLALSQVQYTQRMIVQDSIQQAELARREEVKIQEEIRRKRFDEGMGAYTKYEYAAQTANFEDQLIHLKHFLNTIPDASDFNNNQYNAGAKIDFARNKILDIRVYLTNKKGARYQLEAIPYLNQDLEKKYESMNFAAAPNEVVMDKDTAGVGDLKVKGRELLSAKPRLDIADSSGNIKAVVEAIDFVGDRAVFKLKLQNNTAAEYLAGPMQLSITAKGDEVAKLNPAYVSAYPIILPGKEFFILYATKAVELKDNQSLTFNITDRLKNTKIKVVIPRATYNAEKASKAAN